MKTLIATVGGTADPILISARKMGFDKVVLIAGKPAKDVWGEKAIEGKPNPLKVADSVKRKLEEFGAKVEVVTVDPFNFEECCIETMKILEREKGFGDVCVSVTGGTKIQSIAAACAAFAAGCKVVYVQELRDGAELVEIPYDFSAFDELSQVKKRVITVIEDGDSAAEVSEKLGISRKTVSQYLKELRELGLLEAVDGCVKRYRLTFLGKLCKARWSGGV
ncbi:HFX_2341 family transcriptional regulator domain-containing protein [Archaeoglobus sp.]